MTTTFKFLKTQDDTIKQLKVPARIYEMRLAAARNRRKAYAEWRNRQKHLDGLSVKDEAGKQHLAALEERQNCFIFYHLIEALSCDLHAEEALEEATA